MKRLSVIVLLLLLLTTPILGNEFVFQHLEAYPTQIYAIWSAVEGADYYDCYLDRVPVKRVEGGTMTVIGTQEVPLESQREYELLIIARKQGDKDLAYLAQRIATPAFWAQEFSLLAAHPWPNQIDLFWSMVEEAKYYDLYVDRMPIKRVYGSHGATIGSNEEPLWSNHRYEVMVVARKQGDVQVGMAMTEVTTSAWDGHYRWVNETKKDNKGLVRQLDFRVTSHDDSYRIEGLYDRWRTIYPLVPASQIGEQFAYDGHSEVQRAYRENAQLFNTSRIRPDSWSIVASWQEAAAMGVEVRSRAKGISVNTLSTYSFALNEARGALLFFENSANGIAALSLFQSPNTGDDGIFKAKQILP